VSSKYFICSFAFSCSIGSNFLGALLSRLRQDHEEAWRQQKHRRGTYHLQLYVLRFISYTNLRTIPKLGPWGFWAVLLIEPLHDLTFAVN
jgi:hypothetical protein